MARKVGPSIIVVLLIFLIINCYSYYYYDPAPSPISQQTAPDSDDSDFCPDDGTTAREPTKSRPSRQWGKVKYNFNEDSDCNIND